MKQPQNFLVNFQFFPQDAMPDTEVYYWFGLNDRVEDGYYEYLDERQKVNVQNNTFLHLCKMECKINFCNMNWTLLEDCLTMKFYFWEF